MTFSFHSEAEAEFLAAIRYYEDCERGLGYDFSIEVSAAISKYYRLPACVAGH